MRIRIATSFAGSTLLLFAAARVSVAADNKPSAAKAPAPSYALPSFAPSTGPVTVEQIVAGFERFDQDLQSLTAEFRQLVRLDETGTSNGVEGTLEFKKPSKLRLEHRLPEAQTVVGDGTWLWVWRPSTNQAVKRRFADWKDSEPLAQGLLDFGNYSSFLKSYQVAIATESAPDADGHRRVELSLRPKDKPSEFELRLTLSTKDFFPYETKLRAGQALIQSRFSKVRYNISVPDERFAFTPPPGADVFEPKQAKSKN